MMESAATAPLNDSMLAAVAAVGHERPVERGDVLSRAGDGTPPFIVVLEGEVEVLRGEGPAEVIAHRPRSARISRRAQPADRSAAYLTSRVSEPGRVLVVEPEDFRRLMSTKPELSDTLFRAFVARRELLRSGEGAGAIQVIGSRYSAEAMALRAFAMRSRLPHTWTDVEDIEDVPVFLASLGAHPGDVPLVITPTARLRRPSPGEFAEHLGLTFDPPGYIFDLVVIGTGPAGLAAAVYGASEGLDTVSLDAVAPAARPARARASRTTSASRTGSPVRTSSRRAAIQAQRLGARLNAPCDVAGLRTEAGFHVVALADGSEIPPHRDRRLGRPLSAARGR